MLVTKDELLRFVETAAAGDRCIYHRGISLGPVDASDEVRETASLAMRMWEAGKVDYSRPGRAVRLLDGVAPSWV